MTNHTWNIDTSHSSVQFTVRHMVIAKVRGVFTRWEGQLEFDPEHPTQKGSKARVRIEAASIDTREPRRDTHLRSPDFFDVERFPQLTFESTGVESVGGNRYRVHGDLSIHGVTRPVTLEVEHLGNAQDPWGQQRAAFQAHTQIHRKDFGLTWNQALETGGVLVGDLVDIDIDLQAVKAPAAERAA